MPRAEALKFPRDDAPLMKAGAKAIGKSKSQRAIKQSLAALVEMNELAVRERAKKKAALHKQAARYMEAFESLVKPHEWAAGKGMPRGSASVDLQQNRARLVEHTRPQPIFLLPLRHGFNAFIPPWDYGWHWGKPTQQVSNHQTGRCAVYAQSKHTSAAAAGISVVLTTDKPALVSVRAYVPCHWQWGALAWGVGSIAKVRGGIDASAWVDGALCTPVRRDQLFSGGSSGFDGDEGGEGDGYAGENIDLSFSMSPGKTYAVSFGAWVECDSAPWAGSAGCAGIVDAKVQFLFIDRFVKG